MDARMTIMPDELMVSARFCDLLIVNGNCGLSLEARRSCLVCAWRLSSSFKQVRNAGRLVVSERLVGSF